MSRLLPILLQTPRAPGASSADVLVALGWLTLAAVAAAVAFWLVRKWLLRGADDGRAVGFSLSDLRRMHQEGELTDEQFEAAKAVLIAQQTAAFGGDTAADPLSDRGVSKETNNSSDKNGSGDHPLPDA